MSRTILVKYMVLIERNHFEYQIFKYFSDLLGSKVICWLNSRGSYGESIFKLI
jgi:hypothetical protein